MADPVSTSGERRGTMLPLALALLCIASGVAVVQVKHESRALTAQIDTLRRDRDRLRLEWAQLQLEQATLDQHGRVEALAQTQFNMVEPKDYVIVPERTPPSEPTP